jgi:hypothetical protein
MKTPPQPKLGEVRISGFIEPCQRAGERRSHRYMRRAGLLALRSMLVIRGCRIGPPANRHLILRPGSQTGRSQACRNIARIEPGLACRLIDLLPFAEAHTIAIRKSSSTKYKRCTSEKREYNSFFHFKSPSIREDIKTADHKDIRGLFLIPPSNEYIRHGLVTY